MTRNRTTIIFTLGYVAVTVLALLPAAAATLERVTYKLVDDRVEVMGKIPHKRCFFYRVDLYYKTYRDEKLVKAKTFTKNTSSDGESVTIKWFYQRDGIYDVPSSVEDTYLKINRKRKRHRLNLRFGFWYAWRRLGAEETGHEWYSALPGGVGNLYSEFRGPSISLEMLVLGIRALELRVGGVTDYYLGRILWRPDDRSVEGHKSYGEIDMFTYSAMAKAIYRLPNSPIGIFFSGRIGERKEKYKWKNRDDRDREERRESVLGVEFGIDLFYFSLSGGCVYGDSENGFWYAGASFPITLLSSDHSP